MFLKRVLIIVSIMVVVFHITVTTIKIVLVVHVFVYEFVHIRCGRILVVQISFKKMSSVFTLLRFFTFDRFAFDSGTLYNIKF